MTKAKTMDRSRNQLATAYAPESFFTFEGGLGACISRSTAGEQIDLSTSTQDLIYERMGELGKAWFDTAMQARASDPNAPEVLPDQCVDNALLNQERTGFQLPGFTRFYLCKPSHMEYTPAPLAFACRACNLFRDYQTLNELDAALPTLTKERCPDPMKCGRCDWEQLDVIFVHWSGNWQQPFPGQWHWSQEEGKPISRRDTCVCGSRDFRLNRRAAGIGDWFFECAQCRKPLSQKWLQNDEHTLRMLGPRNGSERLTDVRMQATPYRASSAYYVKSDLFIDFKDGSQQLLSRLRQGRENDLKDFIASEFGFAAQPITDADVEAACTGKPELAATYARYASATKAIQQGETKLAGLDGDMLQVMRNFFEQSETVRSHAIEELRDRGALVRKTDLPAAVIANILGRRSRFAPKFDPVRLAVEHATLRGARLEKGLTVEGKPSYVSFTSLDPDLAPEDISKKALKESETGNLLHKLGIADMGLIRSFDLCRFTFGYSRMESKPVLQDKRGRDMPVRLKLFPTVNQDNSAKYPVYVMQQGNEAIYVRLQEEAVVRWLSTLDCPDMFSLNSGERIGAGILGVAQPMGPFLDGLPEGESPSVYFYLYTLLHSYSHLLMKHIAEYSGLDLGSLGEYIFPADLAFVVYRNGTTMDLGNLSSMWRNLGTEMLSAMLGAKASQCGTGSLCTHRGGACPDCIMVPETSCIAGNKLLSRSVFRSVGGRPRFDSRPSPIAGFLNTIV